MLRAVKRLDLAPSRTFIFASSAVVFVVHLALWIWACAQTGKDFTAMLDHWDASWYTSIVTGGYSFDNRAFPPLYPLVIDIVYKLTGASIPIPAIGLVVSSICIFVFAHLVSVCTRGTSNAAPLLIAPANGYAWLLFLLSPASYVFHSHHTESLFVLLSFLAFKSCADKTFNRAALFAGLAALTRVQGIFVALTCAVWAVGIICGRRATGKKMLTLGAPVFIRMGVISGLLFMIYPIYLGVVFDDPMAYFQSNVGWDAKDLGVSSFFKSFWLGNPWQNHKVGSLIHHVFVGLLAASLLARQWRTPTFVTYVLLNLIVFPCQGEFIDSFRFGAVLFPVFFVWGDWLGRQRMPIRWLALLVFASLNVVITVNYAMLKWAY